MRHIDNWDAIQAKQPGDFNDPAPGGYIAIIIGVEDEEENQRMFIRWDFMTGEFKGENQATFDRAGFWPWHSRDLRSYSDKALPFFKGFYRSVEESNPGYTFDDRNVQGLVGKRMGVVLGEEEYQKNNGEIGTRLYVYQVRSIRAIQEGDFKVPELKKLSGQTKGQPPRQGSAQPASPAFSTYGGGFQPISGGDGDLPF